MNDAIQQLTVTTPAPTSDITNNIASQKYSKPYTPRKPRPTFANKQKSLEKKSEIREGVGLKESGTDIHSENNVPIIDTVSSSAIIGAGKGVIKSNPGQ